MLRLKVEKANLIDKAIFQGMGTKENTYVINIHNLTKADHKILSRIIQDNLYTIGSIFDEINGYRFPASMFRHEMRKKLAQKQNLRNLQFVKLSHTISIRNCSSNPEDDLHFDVANGGKLGVTALSTPRCGGVYETTHTGRLQKQKEGSSVISLKEKHNVLKTRKNITPLPKVETREEAVKAVSARASKHKKDVETEYKITRRAFSRGVKYPMLFAKKHTDGTPIPVSTMTMPFLLGEELETLLYRDQIEKRKGENTISTDERLEIAYRLMRALQKLHAKGIIHRDIKPANVRLQRGAWAKLHILDFDLSTLVDENDGRSSLGTPKYMALEVFYGEPITQASDKVGAARILHEICRGNFNHASDLEGAFKIAKAGDFSCFGIFTGMDDFDETHQARYLNIVHGLAKPAVNARMSNEEAIAGIEAIILERMLNRYEEMWRPKIENAFKVGISLRNALDKFALKNSALNKKAILQYKKIIKLHLVEINDIPDEILAVLARLDSEGNMLQTARTKEDIRHKLDAIIQVYCENEIKLLEMKEELSSEGNPEFVKIGKQIDAILQKRNCDFTLENIHKRGQYFAKYVEVLQQKIAGVQMELKSDMHDVANKLS